MNRSFSILLIACLCVASLSGVPSAVALFTDMGASAGGTAQAGVLDLKLSEIGPATRASTTDEKQRDAVHDTFKTSFAGTGTVSNTLQIDNTKSSLKADRIGIRATYTESDRAQAIDVDAQTTARSFTITTFTYQGNDLLGTIIRDENGNGQYDIDDLTLGQTRTNLATLPAIQVDEVADVRIKIKGNRYYAGTSGLGGDGISVALEISGSASSFTDSDSSTSNTIRYG